MSTLMIINVYNVSMCFTLFPHQALCFICFCQDTAESSDRLITPLPSLSNFLKALITSSAGMMRWAERVPRVPLSYPDELHGWVDATDCTNTRNHYHTVQGTRPIIQQNIPKIIFPRVSLRVQYSMQSHGLKPEGAFPSHSSTPPNHPVVMDDNWMWKNHGGFGIPKPWLGKTPIFPLLLPREFGWGWMVPQAPSHLRRLRLLETTIGPMNQPFTLKKVYFLMWN